MIRHKVDKRSVMMQDNCFCTCLSHVIRKISRRANLTPTPSNATLVTSCDHDQSFEARARSSSKDLCSPMESIHCNYDEEKLYCIERATVEFLSEDGTTDDDEEILQDDRLQKLHQECMKAIPEEDAQINLKDTLGSPIDDVMFMPGGIRKSNEMRKMMNAFNVEKSSPSPQSAFRGKTTTFAKYSLYDESEIVPMQSNVTSGTTSFLPSEIILNGNPSKSPECLLSEINSLPRSISPAQIKAEIVRDSPSPNMVRTSNDYIPQIVTGKSPSPLPDYLARGSSVSPLIPERKGLVSPLGDMNRTKSASPSQMRSDIENSSRSNSRDTSRNCTPLLQDFSLRKSASPETPSTDFSSLVNSEFNKASESKELIGAQKELQRPNSSTPKLAENIIFESPLTESPKPIEINRPEATSPTLSEPKIVTTSPTGEEIKVSSESGSGSGTPYGSCIQSPSQCPTIYGSCQSDASSQKSGTIYKSCEDDVSASEDDSGTIYNSLHSDFSRVSTVSATVYDSCSSNLDAVKPPSFVDLESADDASSITDESDKTISASSGSDHNLDKVKPPPLMDSSLMASSCSEAVAKDAVGSQVPKIPLTANRNGIEDTNSVTSSVTSTTSDSDLLQAPKPPVEYNFLETEEESSYHTCHLQQGTDTHEDLLEQGEKEETSIISDCTLGDVSSFIDTSTMSEDDQTLVADAIDEDVENCSDLEDDNSNVEAARVITENVKLMATNFL